LLTDGRSQHLGETVSLAHLGQRSLLLPQAPEANKLSGFRFYLPRVYFVPGQLSNHGFVISFNLCTHQLKIQKIWRRALIVAIPKPKKSLGDPKN